jgi:hypothetical protein
VADWQGKARKTKKDNGKQRVTHADHPGRIEWKEYVVGTLATGDD